MSGMELFAAGIAGLAGFTGANLADRFAATRKDALVGSPTAPIYKDWVRMGIGVVFAGAPLVGAHFVKSPVWRAGIQGFGLGALFHFGGKLIEDFSAKMLAENETGKKLYAGEIYAQSAQDAAEKQAAEAAKKGAGALPPGKDTAGLAGCGCDDKPEQDKRVPPPPPMGTGASPAAIEAVKRHAPALRALGGIAPAIEAAAANRATPEQKQQIADVQRVHGASLEQLHQFSARELKAAAGLAGLGGMFNGANGNGSPAAPPPPKPSMLAPVAPTRRETDPTPSKFNWAVGQ